MWCGVKDQEPTGLNGLGKPDCHSAGTWLECHSDAGSVVAIVIVVVVDGIISVAVNATISGRILRCAPTWFFWPEPYRWHLIIPSTGIIIDWWKEKREVGNGRGGAVQPQWLLLQMHWYQAGSQGHSCSDLFGNGCLVLHTHLVLEKASRAIEWIQCLCMGHFCPIP